MNQLVIVYDPTNINAVVVSDGVVEATVRGWYDNTDDAETVVIIGSEILITAIRALIAEGVFDHTRVVFSFKGVKIFPDKNGRISDWVKGFGDYTDDFITRILGW